MWTEYIDNIITALVSMLGGGSGAFIFARRKYKADTDSTNIDNMQKSLDFYVRNSEENKAELVALREENKRLRDENVILKNKIADSEVKIHNLELQVNSLKDSLSAIEQSLLDLKKPNRPRNAKKIK